MTHFTVGAPVTTELASVTVDAGLAVGDHRFRLEVVDSVGNVSKPAEAMVRIQLGLVVPPIVPTPADPVIPSSPVIRPNE